MADVTLLPCPFCGGDARMTQETRVGCELWTARCASDECNQMSFEEQSAARCWNRRASAQPQGGADELAGRPREYFDTLDLAYRAVDALGGTGASDAYNSALDAALAAIEALGGMDDWQRKQKGYPHASS